MTTCREIITLGLQLARVVGMGRDPRAAESELGLTVLQGMYDQMFTGAQFARLTDVYATEDYTAKENERIIADNATITIPDTIDVESGEPRTPRDLSAIVVITDVTELHYVFSGGRWETAHALTLDSTAPLATRDKVGLAALLAMYLSEAFGPSAALGPMWTRKAMQFQGSLSYKLGSTQDAAATDHF
jgi:hypothetical protein